MQRILVSLLFYSVTLLFSLSLFAEPIKYTGWITDEHCGPNGAKQEHKPCAQKCVDGGRKLVLWATSEKKIYTLDDQASAKRHLGYEVLVEGELESDGGILVKRITPTKK
jgi:hypothetical protein